MAVQNKITVGNLIQQYRAYNPDGHFFDREILKGYGESISRMRVNGIGAIQTREGNYRICYELEALQRIPELGSRLKKYYFDAEDYTVVTPGDDNTATPWTGAYEKFWSAS